MTPGGRPGKADIRRRHGTRAERRKILIVTEGERTEPDYFKGLARAVRATGVRVAKAKIIGAGADPETVVRQAIDYRDREEDLDACWCVVDVDSHATLDRRFSSRRPAT